MFLWPTVSWCSSGGAVLRSLHPPRPHCLHQHQHAPFKQEESADLIEQECQHAQQGVAPVTETTRCCHARLSVSIRCLVGDTDLHIPRSLKDICTGGQRELNRLRDWKLKSALFVVRIIQKREGFCILYHLIVLSVFVVIIHPLFLEQYKYSSLVLHVYCDNLGTVTFAGVCVWRQAKRCWKKR